MNFLKSKIVEFFRRIIHFYKNTKSNKNLELIKGKVENTLLIKKNLPDKISVLKIDTCLYESTKVILEILSPRVEKEWCNHN